MQADALKTIDSIKHCCADITPAHHLSFAPISKADTSSPPEFQVKLEVGRAELLGELGSSVARLTDAPSHFTTGIGVVVMTSMMNTFCFPRPKVRSTLRIRGEEQGSGKKTGPVSSVRIDNLSLTPYRDSEIAPSTLSEHDDDGETFYTRTAAANIDLLSSGGTRLLAIATATLGNSHLFFLDPQSSKIISCFRLWEFVRVGPADSCLQGIEMIDDEGHSWQFHPEGIDEDDSQRLRLRWLQILWSIVRSPTTVYTIIKRGTLSKKGRVNKSFKPRFCELSSDLKLRYYKCDSGWTYKGQIDLILLDRFTIGKTGDVTRFEQLICLSMQRANRVWVLKADSESEAQEWELAINDLLQVWGGKDSAAMASLPRNPERTSEGASSDDGT